jgi:hypothetical protein
MTVRRAIMLLVVIASSPIAAGGQAAAVLPMDDAAYGIIDRLESLLPSAGVFMGQRPYSRRAVSVIARHFESALERNTATLSGETRQHIQQLLIDLRRTYEAPSTDDGGRDRFAARTTFLGEAVGTNVGPREVPRSNGLGTIAALTDPLTDPSGGRRYGNGTTIALEVPTELGIGGWLAVGARPRGAWVSDGPAGRRFSATMQELYTRAMLWNTAIEVGATERLWGQSEDRGLLLSANAHPLHAITLTNDTALAAQR